MNVTRKSVWFYWLAGSIISSILSSTTSMCYWHLTYAPEPNVSWSPMDDTWGMFIIMPFGLVLSVMTPAGWLNITGLVLALYKINLKPLVLSVVGSILFGFYWPKYFVAMMGI